LPREDEIDFSQTIYQGGIGVLVSAASGVNSLAGLNVGTVAVPEDGFTTDAVQSAAIPAGISIAVETINDDNQALAGITDGRYLGFAKWRSELLNLAYTNPGFLVLDERLTTRPIALGIRQYDAAFEDLVNLTLQALAVDGVFAAVYDDWFGTDPSFSLEIWSGSPYRPLRLRRQPGVVATPAP
jgi:ABC-type amino acid transport substrate-binding protein